MSRDENILLTRALVSTSGLSRQQLATWAGLCRRFPDLTTQLEHCVGLMAAQAGHINVTVGVSKGIGGFVAWVTLYSPHVIGNYQRFMLNDPSNHKTPGEYPSRFSTLTDAVEAAEHERGCLERLVQG